MAPKNVGHEAIQSWECSSSSEKLLRSIFLALPIGIGLVENRVIRQVNQEFCRMIGYTAEELIGQSSRILYPSQEEFEMVGDVKYAQIRNQGTGTVETRMKRKNGSVFDVILSSAPLNPDDLSLGVTFTVMDITLRRKAESQRDLLFNYSIDMLCIAGVDGYFKQVNPAWEKTLGWSTKELTTEPILSFVHPEELESSKQALDQLRENQELRTFQNRFRCKDGSYRWISWNSCRLKEDDLLLAVARDVTDQIKVNSQLHQANQELFDTNEQLRASENALRESETRYRLIFEHAASLIMSVDRDGILVGANVRTRDVLGYERDELIGRPLRTIIHSDCRKDAQEAVRTVFETGSLTNHRKKMVRKDGEVIDVRVDSSLLHGAGNRPDRTVCIVSDETEERRVQAEMEKTARLESLGVLAGGIAHDFNNLLGGLFGYIDLAVESADCGSKSTEYLRKALRSYHRARDLTLQLLTFSRGGAPRRSAASLETLVREASALAVTGTSARCSYRVKSPLWYADIDAGQVNQVINNIVLNARQAMGDAGTILVEIANREVHSDEDLPVGSGKYVQVTISDTGIGIRNDEIERIFDPFFTTKQQGSGLGLAVSYSIVKHHGGHISVHSTPGEGTTFTLLLPASAECQEAEGETENMIVEGENERVLIMDDEEIILELARRMLERLKYRVGTALNGGEAISEYRTARENGDPFDIVILDLTVSGGMGGMAALEEIRKFDPDVKAIVSSGYSEEPVMCNPHDYGFKEGISKPYRVADFSAVIRKVLES